MKADATGALHTVTIRVTGKDLAAGAVQLVSSARAI